MPSNRTRLILKTAAATLLAAAVLGGGCGGYVVFKAGWYNIGATALHTQPVHDVLEQGMRDSVEHRARDVAVPAALVAPQRIAARRSRLPRQCAQCHGAPGFAQSDHRQGDAAGARPAGRCRAPLETAPSCTGSRATASR